MTPHSWYEVTKDFAGPLATVLAAGAATYFASRFQAAQVDVARGKLNLDLYDRKIVIYQTLSEMFNYSVLAHFGVVEIDGNKFQAFYKTLNEADFLMKKETLDFIKESEVLCSKFASRKQESDSNIEIFQAMQLRLPEVFKKELDVTRGL